MSKMSKVKGRVYGGLDKEFRLPKNLSEERKKLIWLHNKLREVLENNSFSKVKADNLKQYTIALEEAVDYILGIGDYRKLTNEARRIVMFLLSIRKAWSLTPKLIHKKPEEIFKFLNIDFLPDIRKQVILDFLEEPVRKPFKDWEVKIILDPELSNIQVMYQTGRTYESIRSYRMHRKIEKRKAII